MCTSVAAVVDLVCEFHVLSILADRHNKEKDSGRSLEVNSNECDDFGCFIYVEIS